MKTKANKTKSDDVTEFLNIRLIMATLFIGMLIVAIFQLDFETMLPIKKIRAQGEFINVTEKMILDAIADDVRGGYLKVNVRSLQTKIEKLAWVKLASVRRVWPDSVVVKIKEQKARAIWKNNGLLNELGEQFKPKTIKDIKLPVLSGPRNLSIKVMNEYKIIEAQLNKINLTIVEFDLDDRRAINLSLSNNITISLGRSNYKQRLKRFITAYKINLQNYSDEIEYVDMRYTNGFSIKLKKNTQAAKAENVLRGLLDV